MINKAKADALRVYLVSTGYVANKRVKKLIIDACGVSDESLSSILDGIYG